MKERSRGISRREFLKIGVLSAAAFLAELAIPENVRANLDKLLEGREFISITFEEGIERLREKVFNKKTESVWAYIERGVRKGWMDIANPETEKEDEITTVDLAPIFNDPEINKISLAHTHPVSLYKTFNVVSLEQYQTIIDQRKSPFPFVPSSGDILDWVGKKKFIIDQKLSLNLEAYVAEPSGVWQYDVNLNHPKIKRLALSFHSEREVAGEGFIESLILEKEMIAEQKKFVEEGGISEKNLAAFLKLAEEKWGIILRYRPAE